MFYLITGISLGLAAAITPGPLTFLVISETLKGNWKNGLAVTVSPLVTDPFLAVFVLLIISKLNEKALSVLSIFGGFFLFYLAYENLTFIKFKILSSGNSLKKGMLTNFLNPHPYLFWFTIGGPLIINSWHQNKAFSFLFLFSFYATFLGLVAVLALLINKIKRFDQVKYRYFLWVCSAIFVVLGFVFIRNGLDIFI